MIGDTADIVSRLRAGLPRGWFAENSPNLQSVLTSIATPWAWIYSLISYVIQQTRLYTAAADWLDLIAFDFFGFTLGRKPGESDLAFRVASRSRWFEKQPLDPPYQKVWKIWSVQDRLSSNREVAAIPVAMDRCRQPGHLLLLALPMVGQADGEA